MSEPDIGFGEHLLRIRKMGDTYVGIVVGDASTKFADPDRVKLIKKLQDAALSGASTFVGYDGAIYRFLKLFPQGFSDPNYVGGESYGEQHYKRLTAFKVAKALPLNQWQTSPSAAEDALRLFRASNLIDPFTKTALQNVLRGQKALRFIELCQCFAEGDIQYACGAANAEFKNEKVAKWPALTYLAFFWKPEKHMFLKPEFTKEYAQRVGHSFSVNYRSELNEQTYLELLDMAEETANLVDSLPKDEALDMIDIHSFMWAVIDYEESDVGPKLTNND